MKILRVKYQILSPHCNEGYHVDDLQDNRCESHSDETEKQKYYLLGISARCCTQPSWRKLTW